MSSTSEPPIRVARWIERTDAEGPGTRFALWVQGCALRCPGCFNPHLWSARGGTAMTPREVLAAVPADVDGVTLLGGEPFEQAGALAAFARLVRERGQNVMTFTGHTVEELRGDADADALLAATDLLVDGPYVADDLDTARPWVGSRNQRFHALTPAYADLVAELEAGASAAPDRIEVRVRPDGTLSVNGWARTADLETLLDGLDGRRVPADRFDA